MIIQKRFFFSNMFRQFLHALWECTVLLTRVPCDSVDLLFLVELHLVKAVFVLNILNLLLTSIHWDIGHTNFVVSFKGLLRVYKKTEILCEVFRNFLFL